MFAFCCKNKPGDSMAFDGPARSTGKRSHYPTLLASQSHKTDTEKNVENIRSRGAQEDSTAMVSQGLARTSVTAHACSIAPEPNRSSDRWNLDGKWVCARLEGDAEGLLAELGSSWVHRLGFRVGWHTQAILHYGDCLEIEESCGPFPLSTIKNYYIVDGREQDTLGIDGLPTRSTVCQEGHSFTSRQWPAKAGAGPTTIVRYFLQPARTGAEAEELCVETEAPSGLRVRRYYERRE
jgi:hypothetical protein